MANTRTAIAVIGAGVIGLAVARQLALRGAEVTVIDQAGIGAGTSTTTFGWVNANGKSPDSYFALNAEGMREHVRLQAQTDEHRSSGRWFVAGGTYQWVVDEDEAARLQTSVERMRGLGYSAEEISASELKTQIPEVRVDPRAKAIWRFAEEGYVWPSLLLARLWSEAREHGARLWAPAEVVDIVESADRVSVTLSDGEVWTGDLVVSAAGRWSAQVMDTLGIALAMTDANRVDPVACGFLGGTSPVPVQLRAHLMVPGLSARPDGGGRLLLQSLDLDEHADPVYRPDPEGLIGQTMLQRVRALFENTATARLERLVVGQRSRPLDGHPGVGFVTDQRRVYLAVTHSGITLGPLLGRLVAEEVIDGNRSELLADYDPERLITR